VLNYSWKAGPNRWGRLEFNATFSISFWNGLTADRDCDRDYPEVHQGLHGDSLSSRGAGSL
jgi:hypothetical protein